MLRGIRTASTNWLGRVIMGVVMGLLAASFAIWGINDIFRGFGRSTIAKIGDTEISIEAYRRAYNDRLQAIGRQFGRPLDPEQARALGVDRQVLSELLSQSAIDQRARQMRLGISDQEILHHITNDPNFSGPNGKFDRMQFQQLLRGAGYSEQRYAAEQRLVMLRRQLVDSLSGDLQVPQGWLQAINQFQNEQRAIDYVTLGPAQAGEVTAPTAEELQKYFDARKIMFRAPEYRKIVTVAVLPGDLGKWMDIPQADLQGDYDQHRSRYLTAERRHVEQIVFPTQADAEAADARIKGGLSFAALATERGLKEADIDLGTVAKSELIDPSVADAAFALKEGEVSAPVKGKFGTVLVTVVKIVPEVQKSFTDVAPQIRQELAAERAKAEIRSLHEKMEDERAGGASVEQAAQKFNLPLVTAEAVDRSGRDPNGQLVTALPHSGQVLEAAFRSDVGVDNDPIEVDGGYVWYEVAGGTPAHERSLDEVKAQVEQHWRDDEISSRVKAKAADLLDRLTKGATLEDAAKTDNLTIGHADKIERNKPTEGLPARAVATIYHTAKDGFGSAEGSKTGEWVVFRVIDVTVPPFDANAAETKRIKDIVRKQEGEDIFSEYIMKLEDDLGTSINQAALAQALGNAPADTN